MVQFSIIIVSWNALGLLKAYLPSVWKNTGKSHEIILADNASADGTADWVQKNYPGIKVLSMDKNLGYCAGNNRAANIASGDYLLFLNNDVQVTPGWLEALGTELSEHPKIAAAQPKLLSLKNRQYFDYSGAAGGYLDYYGYPFCRGRIFNTLESDTGQYQNPQDIVWASGAALAIKRSIFLESGGFEESFKFHMEEIDLCWRLINKGYRIRYCPDSVVYHLGGGSLPSDSPRKLYYNYRNNLRMLIRNGPKSNLWLRIGGRMALDFLSLLRELVLLKPASAAAIIKAYYHALSSLSALLQQRKDLFLSADRNTSAETLAPFSIVWHYFIRRKKHFSELPKLVIHSQNE